MLAKEIQGNRKLICLFRIIINKTFILEHMHGHQWLNADASSQVFDGSKAQQKNAVEGGGGVY